MCQPLKSVLILLACSAVFVHVSFGQTFEAPQYKKIEKAIKKKGSSLYYPKLMERFLTADSTMTLEERKHLYYGYTFQDDYSPYRSSDYQDSLRALFSSGDLSEDDIHKTVSFSDSLLALNPFDLRAINFKLNAFNRLKLQKEFNQSVVRMTIVLDAIMYSGDGMTKETAFYVITVNHEYDVLSILELNSVGQSLIDHYDYLELAQNDAGIEGLYFDITPCLSSMSKMFSK
jgi:hypothetical protein